MNILITGASNGIGCDTALKFTEQEGNTVVAIARSEKNLQELSNRSNDKKGKIIPLQFDLRSGNYSRLQEVTAKLGHLDIIINNAGQLVNKPFPDLTDDEWQLMYDVNLFGPVKLIRTLLPFIEKANKPHIINISSMGGFQGSKKFPGLSAYSTSKAAICSLTECLSEELKDRNIAVNCLALGMVETEMLQEAFPGIEAPVSSADMAEFIVNFSVNSHRFMNGKIIPVALADPG